MDLDQVTLAQMRAAVAVIETGSFRAAAARCHITQSGLSMQIQRLEELLGRRIFDRSKKPVRVTPEGELALAQMRAVLRETRRLGQIVAEDDEPAGPFRLAVIPTLAASLLPLCLAEFGRRHPRVELTVEELETAQIIARLQADTLDAGLAAVPLGQSGLQERKLASECMFAYLPPGDPLLKKSDIRQSELSSRELWVMPQGHCFRTQVLSYCGTREARGPAGVRFESGSFETLIRLVDSGMGATVLPELVAATMSAARRRARVRPLRRPTPVRDIGLVTARTDLRRRVCDALVEVLEPALARALGRRPRNPLVLDPL